MAEDEGAGAETGVQTPEGLKGDPRGDPRTCPECERPALEPIGWSHAHCRECGFTLHEVEGVTEITCPKCGKKAIPLERERAMCPRCHLLFWQPPEKVSMPEGLAKLPGRKLAAPSEEAGAKGWLGKL
ncbi:MAG: hypothetical protein ACP5IJ_01840, partial [Candidatus Nanoarchaeia archaeon]